MLKIEDLEISVERKRIKNLHLRVGRTGKLTLTAPAYVSDGEIKAFAVSKYEWMKKHLQSAKAEDYRLFIHEGKVTIFGEEYAVVYGKGGGWKDALYLKCAAEEGERYAAKEMRRILAQKIAERLPYWEEKTGLKATSCRIRDMKTRWGTCNVQTGTIWINLQLVKRPTECLDYIIVHELGHLLNRYHDKRFYNYMRYNFRDYERVRESLKK